MPTPLLNRTWQCLCHISPPQPGDIATWEWRQLDWFFYLKYFLSSIWNGLSSLGRRPGLRFCIAPAQILHLHWAFGVLRRGKALHWNIVQPLGGYSFVLVWFQGDHVGFFGFLPVREWIMRWSRWFWSWSSLILNNNCCDSKCWDAGDVFAAVVWRNTEPV